MPSLQYSKSSRATCHGPAPCTGSPIELGSLRYGQVSAGKFGETVEWRHWQVLLCPIRVLLLADWLSKPRLLPRGVHQGMRYTRHSHEVSRNQA